MKLRFYLPILHPNQFDHPSYHRVGRDPAVGRSFSIGKVRTHARLPGSAFAHSDDTTFQHGGGITAPDFESILTAGLIIRAGNSIASV